MSTAAKAFHAEFEVSRYRQDFPVLQRAVRGKPLVYLDNAATSQKPSVVIDALEKYYSEYNANIHRGVHTLSEEATVAYEDVRELCRNFVNASSVQEIIFTKGTTEAINLVANTYGRSNLEAGDEIIISWMEHHSNIVPWQLLCEQNGAVLKVVPIDDDGAFVMDEYIKLLSPKTKIVAIGHISNALGSINPVKEIARLAHEQGAVVLVDGAQATPHTAIDVQDLDCDFYAFSSHKVFGPTGVGVLYGRQDLLEAMPPYQGGGDMIKMVTFEKTLYSDLPNKYEAGTPNISGVIGLGAALNYLNSIGIENIAAYENELLDYATDAALKVEGLRIIGTAENKASILSFVIDKVHPHDLGTILDHDGIAIRTGHHCAMPVMDRFKVPATARASFAFYNTRQEVDILMDAINNARKVFA
ncbi:MAG: SufS family cysteine desulfurase [Gammaproteobacteria bacterium]|nr:SufS family cysteine desulfurase [Gammaproteobacteria bacterium]